MSTYKFKVIYSVSKEGFHYSIVWLIYITLLHYSLTHCVFWGQEMYSDEMKNDWPSWIAAEVIKRFGDKKDVRLLDIGAGTGMVAAEVYTEDNYDSNI